MRKSICLVGIGSLFVSLVLIGCASAPKTLVTTSNLPALRGTWQGWTSFGIGKSRPVLTWVEIVGDTVPVTARITLNNVPDPVALIFPAEVKTAGNNVTFQFTDGVINNQGALFFQNGKNVLEITYFAGEKPKIEGWFYYWTVKGTFDANRK